MTVFTLTAPMPEMTVPGGTLIRFGAISPTTGAAVTGVAVTQVAVYGYDLSDETTAIEDVIPAYTSDTSG